MIGGLKINNPLSMIDFSIKNQSLPTSICLPIFENEPIVKIGDKVLTGELLAASKNTHKDYTHSSISGEVIDISNKKIPHQSDLSIQCITIKGDGLDNWITIKKPDDFLLATPQELITKLSKSGIVGLGGAGFLIDKKLKFLKNCHTIIINGCECEPAIEADNALMQEYPREILRGIEILLYITNAKKAIIAIEGDKQKAFDSLILLNSNPKISVQMVTEIYGSGAEKSLINTISGIDIDSGKFAGNYGILMQNIATTKAIFDYIIDGIPLIQRVVTIATNGTPYNSMVRVGTKINTITATKNIRIGGLMMGLDLANNDYPVLKTTNGIFTADTTEKEVLECIRCGDCVEVCPAQLLPQQLYWFAKNKNIAKCLDYNLMDCTSCRCCDEVCGSNIPLSKYFTFAKQQHLKDIADKELATKSSERFEFREYRLKRNKQERDEMMARKREEIKAKNAELAEQNKGSNNAIN